MKRTIQGEYWPVALAHSDKGTWTFELVMGLWMSLYSQVALASAENKHHVISGCHFTFIKL